MADFAKESTHWYKPDGEPCYTVIGKNGKERNTTLRDARTLGLVPSVTGIIRMAAAPGLEKWKRNQVLLSALTLPRKEGESEQDWLARVEQDWQEQGRDAAAIGTAIHGAIEQFYRAEYQSTNEFVKFVAKATKEILEKCGSQEWSAERSFAHELGYGGKTDLHSSDWVVDIKTKDNLEGDLYDEHFMQLAAYRHGLGVKDARCGILFVNRNVPEAKFIEVSAGDLERGFTMFKCLLEFWKARNKI